jgi:ribosomal protein RSM22 (predicted rRNA methylase)
MAHVSLRDALETTLSMQPARELAAAVRDLSRRYREEHGRAAGPFLRTRLDVAAYAAYRLPATYAAAAAALHQLRESRPDFAPRSVLDAGGGPGTAGWAVAETWPGTERITVLERDPNMIDLGRELAAQAGSAAIRTAEWRRVDLAANEPAVDADLVVMAYVLGELGADGRERVVRGLWERTGDTFVLVEPGTPRGFALIHEAGDLLAAEGGQAVAPFPWTWNCLEHEGDWCHFSARVPRTRLHRTVKDAALSYEDEKFSFVAMSRVPGLPIAARVIRHPQVRSGHIRLTLCAAGGVKHVVVTRKNKDAFRLARDLKWGSSIGAVESEVLALGSSREAKVPES